MVKLKCCGCGKNFNRKASRNSKRKFCSQECYREYGQVTHGLSRTKFYKRHADMMKRCYDSNVESYKYAGGRGIRVCKRWHRFENFRDDMYDEYLEFSKTNTSRDVTLERTDNNRGYSKSNCKWATQFEQSRNKRNLRMITFNGKTMCAVDWENELNLYRNCIYNRVSVRGWSMEKALTTKPRWRHKK